MEVTLQIGRVDQGRSIQAKAKMLTRIVAHNVDYFSLCCLKKQVQYNFKFTSPIEKAFPILLSNLC